MSTVALISAKGAPGTTTTAMLVASLWPRPALLVDADAAGGDIGLRLPAPDGRPLDLTRGMLSLLPQARRALSPEQVLAHAQPVLGGGEVVAGVAGPEQAAAAGPVWAVLADALRRLVTHDVVIDLGRTAATSALLPLAAGADLVVLVARDTVTGVVAARSRLRAVLPALTGPDGSGPRLGLVVVGTDDREAEAAASVLVGELAQLTYLGRVAWDPAGARLFDGRPVSRPERTLLVRSGRALVARLDAALEGVGGTAAAGTAPADRATVAAGAPVAAPLAPDGPLAPVGTDGPDGPDAPDAPDGPDGPIATDGPAGEPAVPGAGRSRSEERAAQRSRLGRRRREQAGR